MNFENCGIWSLVEEYQLREKAKELGYIIKKDTNSGKVDKMFGVTLDFVKATNNLRCFLLSTFIVASDWKLAITIIGTFSGLVTISALFKQKR